MSKRNSKVLYFWIFFVLSLRILFYFLGVVKYPNGTEVRMNVRVRSEPILYSNTQYFKVYGLKVYLPLYPRVYYGDRITLTGVVKDGKLKNPKLIQVNEGGGILYKYRQELVLFFERNLPKDHAALVSGIVIGSKAGIGEKLWNALKKSGTAHVVVASGMNVTLVAGFLISVLIIILPRRKAVWGALVGIWIYAILSGFDAPIVRATVMGSGAFLAVATGRMYQGLRFLLISAYMLLFVKPVWITDLGFWLSFVASASIILFSKRIGWIFRFFPKIVKEDLATTLSAQIGVTPILYYFFGQFNILSPVINILVLWTIVPITIIGMFSGMVGTIIEPLGRIFLYLCYPLTSWFLFVVEIF